MVHMFLHESCLTSIKVKVLFNGQGQATPLVRYLAKSIWAPMCGPYLNCYHKDRNTNFTNAYVAE